MKTLSREAIQRMTGTSSGGTRYAGGSGGTGGGGVDLSGLIPITTTFWGQSVADGAVQGSIEAGTRSLNSGYVAFTGLGIGVQDMDGLIEFYCLGSHSNGTAYATDEQCNIKSLSFGFARLASSAEHNNLSKNVYTATNNSKFADEKDIELIFASDNGNSAGYGIIMNPSGSYCDQVNYGSGNASHPEQHLANRIASLLSDVLIKKTVELNSQTLGTVTPGHMSADGYPIAISHEWRDDVTQLKILQL